jgi:hypothetical protein
MARTGVLACGTPLALVLLLAAGCTSVRQEPLPGTGRCELWIGGRMVTSARHAIVIPDQPTVQERRAAEDLALHIGKMTGQQLAVLGESALGRQTPIAVGRCEATLRKLGVAVDFGSLGDEGVAIETHGAALVLAGNRRGVLYAVYTFLEDYCGCRWYTPDCSSIPQTGRLAIPRLGVRYRPPLELRSTDYPCSLDADWAVRNKINGTQTRLDVARGGKISYSHFVHTFNSLVSPDRHFAAHPEYFSEVDGTRLKERTQLCLTNPDVLALAREAVRQWIRESPSATIFSVSQNDWGNYCTCAKCKALAEAEGSQAGPLIAFVNGIAGDIAKDYPDKIIDTLAYQWSRKPPRSIRPLTNVCVRLCSIECCFVHPLEACPKNRSFVDDIRGWNALCNRLYVWDYVINYAHCVMPFPNLDVLRPNIRFFADHGVKGLYEEACYFTQGSELAELRTWIMAKTMWDPAYDTSKATEEFLTAYYGPAAEPLRKYLDLMHRQAAEHPDWHMTIYSPPTVPNLRPEVVAEAAGLFDAAEARVAGDAVLAARVRVARLPVTYLQIVNAKPGDGGSAERLRSFDSTAKQEGVSAAREGGDLDEWIAAQRRRLGIGR